MNNAFKASELRYRERLLASRTYDAPAELIEFYRSRAPKSEATINLDPGALAHGNDSTAMERLSERAESMVRAADRNAIGERYTWIELKDAAEEYLSRVG
jgi:hypothetical protein